LFLPSHLAVVNEGVVSIVLFHLLAPPLLAIAGLGGCTVGPGSCASHGNVSVHITIAIHIETEVFFGALSGRLALIVALEGSTRSGNTGETLFVRGEARM
jgi:hypothetical protein